MAPVFLVNRVNVPVIHQHWCSELGTWVDVWAESEVKRGGLRDTPQWILTPCPVDRSGLKAVECN